MIGILTAAALAVASAQSAPADKPGEDSIFEIRDDDAEMNAAIAEGRRTLGQFLSRLAAPQPGDIGFVVKFDIDPSEGVEYVWAGELDRSRTPMTGTLLNQPVQTNDRYGDRVLIPQDRIIDWGYRTADGVMQGSFTNRVLLRHMPPEEAEEHRRSLGW